MNKPMQWNSDLRENPLHTWSQWPEETIRGKICDAGYGNSSSDVTPKAEATEARPDKLDDVKM